MADENDSGELESAERSTIATVKTKRAVVKRRITNKGHPTTIFGKISVRRTI